VPCPYEGAYARLVAFALLRREVGLTLFPPDLTLQLSPLPNFAVRVCRCAFLLLKMTHRSLTSCVND
jgi:hypothetical protein